MRLNYNKLGYGLSRELWLVQIGIFLNTFGWGAVLPFEVIYLHDGRGLSLGTAGLVVGTLTGAAVVSAPLAGRLIDRVGARTTAVAAGSALAAGYAGLAFAHSAGAAFAAAVIGGVGNGALSPAQTTLLVTLTRREYRHRATAVSRVCTNAGFGFGGAAGGLCAAHGLNGYILLFLLNAATYLVYVVVLVACVSNEDAPERLPGGYRRVVRDRAFVQLALANVAVIGVGWGVLPWVVPPFATRELGVGPKGIGLLMLANAATVVVVQVPVARFSEGRRRVVMMATGSIVFAAACLLDPFGSRVRRFHVGGTRRRVGRDRDRGVLPLGRARAARRRSRAARAARPLPGRDRRVLVVGPCAGADCRHAAPHGVGVADVRYLRRRCCRCRDHAARA